MLLNNVEVPVSGPKLQHPGKQPCSGFLSLRLIFLSTHCHFPSKTHQLPYYTHTHVQIERKSVHTNLFAVLCLIPSIPPPLPSIPHSPCFFPSLADAFLFSPFHLCRIIQRFRQISQGTPQTFSLFCS